MSEQDSQSLRVHIVDLEGVEHQGSIGDTTDDQLECSFVSQLQLPIGHVAQLTIRGSGSPGEFRTITTLRRDSSHGHDYRFELDGEGSFRDCVFRNRRSAFRVNPAEDEKIQVLVHDAESGTPVRAELNDLSRLGLSFNLLPGDERHLFRARAIRARFGLPDAEGTFNLVGVVRVRLKVGGKTRYGLEFDLAQCPKFDDQETRMNQYIMRRQREMLAEKRSKAA